MTWEYMTIKLLAAKLLAAPVLTVLLGVSVGYLFYQQSLSPDNRVYQGGKPRPID
jgi:hypothetical protein